MPQQLINIGTNPNDGTGTPWREAWRMVNEMFTEVYATLSSFVSTTTFTDTINTLNIAIGAVTTAVSSKAEATAVAGKADLSSVVPRNAPATIPVANRLIHAQNSGEMITFAYRIAADDVDLGSVYLEVNLPAFPKDFQVADISLVFDKCDGGVLTAQLLAQPVADYIARWITVPVPVNPHGYYPQEAAPSTMPRTLIPALNALTFTMSSFSSHYTASPTLGAVLWIRGVWAQ